MARGNMLEAFRISPHEVTIGQYAEFLEILNTLAKDGREKVFDQPDNLRKKPPISRKTGPRCWPPPRATASGISAR